jgi:hypothetical protein
MLISGFSSPKALLLGVVIVSTIVVAAGKAPGVAAGPRPTIPMIHAQRPDAAAGYSGSVSGAILNATTPAFGVFGVEGFVPYDVGGVGILGYAQAAKSYGVYGVTFGANGTGVYGTADSATPAPTTTANSATESIGVVGNSAAGDGVYGSTSFGAGSDYFSNPIGGVMGVDAVATSGPSNNGVVGMTTNGAFGVDGIGGANAYGGVAGYSPSGTSVYGYTPSGTGVLGYSGSSSGVVGATSGDFTDFDNNGNGGGTFYGSYVSLLAQTNTPNTTESYPFDLRDANSTDVFYVDNSGDTYVYGTLYLANGQSTFARTRSAGMHATTYTANTSKPTLEDVGEGELAGGQAFVKLDPSFAQAIDSTTPYHVFITPEGDTRGVYVAQKSMTGFTVRENQGGRSTTSFSYRIVASQYGQENRRMALQPDSMIQRPTHGGHLAVSRTQLELRKLLNRPHKAATLSHFVPRPIDNSRVH